MATACEGGGISFGAASGVDAAVAGTRVAGATAAGGFGSAATPAICRRLALAADL